MSAAIVMQNPLVMRCVALGVLMTAFGVAHTFFCVSAVAEELSIVAVLLLCELVRVQLKPATPKEKLTEPDPTAVEKPSEQLSIEETLGKVNRDSDQESTTADEATSESGNGSSSSGEEQDSVKPSRSSIPYQPVCTAKMKSRLSPTLSKILRHTAKSWGLELGADGYVLVSDLLKLEPFAELGAKLCHVEEVVQWEATTKKQRFSLRTGPRGREIRANQGHSDTMVVDKLLTRSVSTSELPELVVHGTYLVHLEKIIVDGLRPMARNHIHLFLAKGGVGRKDAEVLIYVNVARTAAAGIEFLQSENGVVLSTGGEHGVIPPSCFEKICQTSDGALLYTPEQGWVSPMPATASSGKYVPPHKRTSQEKTKDSISAVSGSPKYVPPHRRRAQVAK